MRVLVTGAAGFVGRAFVYEGRSRGWDLVPVVRKPSGIHHEVCVDLASPDAAEAMDRVGPLDAIAHFAMHVNFSESATSGDFFDVGPAATAMLARLARHRRARLVLASGVMVLGPQTHFDDRTAPAPAHAYARSKLLCEQITSAADIPATILRIGGVFGRNGPAHLRLNRAIDSACDRGAAPTVEGRGAGRRNYMFVDDLANTVATCIERNIDGTHLVAGGETLSIAAMMRLLCEVLLPGQQPILAPGDETADMIVEPSPALPCGRDFAAALRQIQLVGAR